MKYKVIHHWEASYPNPICIKAGDRLQLTGRQDNWDGHIWLWAVSETGLEGWIPDSIITENYTGSFAKEDYSAMELSCETGQILSGDKETHG